MYRLEQLIQEKQYLMQNLQKLTEKLRTLPEGALRIEKNGKYEKWLWVHKEAGDLRSKRTFISKNDRAFASDLALKKYLTLRRNDYLDRLRSLEKEIRFRKSEKPVHSSAWDALVKDQALRALIPDKELAIADELAAWQNQSYERSKDHPEHLVIEMPDGTMCRSKSERTIAQELIRYSIPYLYECKTLIGNMIMYPDFTVRNRRHGKQYIWEHNGRMTDESYFGSAMYRERIYLQNNYIPGVNLIMTYETEACPLNISTIDQMIETYLI